VVNRKTEESGRVLAENDETALPLISGKKLMRRVTLSLFVVAVSSKLLQGLSQKLLFSHFGALSTSPFAPVG
jgi:hypothetical protein